MVDRVAQSASSRIPVPVRATGHTLANNKVKQLTKEQPKHIFQENGLVDTHSKIEENSSKDNNAKKDKGFETFVMTGDMIIRTTQKTRDKVNRSTSDSTDTSDTGDLSDIGIHTNAVFIEEKGVQEYTEGTSLTKDNQRSAESGFEDQDSGTLERDRSQATEPNSVSDLSLISSEDLAEMTRSQSSAASTSVSSVSTPSDIKSDISEQTVLQCIVGKNEHSSEQLISPETEAIRDSDTYSSCENVRDYNESEKDTDYSKMVTSKSAEKFVQTKGGGHQSVRPSKSQELQSEFSLVTIDIEEDNKAYSLDQIPQHGTTNSTASLEGIGEGDVLLTSRSLDSSPEHKADKCHDKEFIPGFITLVDEAHMKKAKTKEDSEMFGDGAANNNCLEGSQNNDNVERDNEKPQRYSLDPSLDPNLLEYQPLAKGVDRPSAQRLAKRLYNLDGFKKSDVSRHLSKKNDFGALVSEEYLKFFSFDKDTLDLALRKFLLQFSLIGETQERERVLAHFSKRYIESNQGIYNSEDACHTLTCAIMLLNTDLHGQSIGRKMTCAEFIENLAELNDGDNFPKELLKVIYQNIKAEPIEWAADDDHEEDHSQTEDRSAVSLTNMSTPTLSFNPFLDVPDPDKATEYKNGYVMRKCCMEADRRRTPLGKRGWKMYYVSLRDLIFYLYKDQHGMKKGQLIQGSNNAIRIHHCLASKANDYTKKQHVFRLNTADGAEYLFQTSDSRELQEWIDTINFVSASLSSPQLPGAVGSQKKFQRPLLPATYTKFNLHDQLQRHEVMCNQVENDLQDHRQFPPEKGAKSRLIQDYLEKESFLESELKRYKTYTYLLQSRMTAYPELEPSLVETVIGEDEENGQSDEVKVHQKRPVQRSLSDRRQDMLTVGTLV
ncbi:PH and SEC7 domain-containing protein 2-like isoform X2 [Pecten maximus]|uniref:PH and SEC7 domain-containing protein 2-like isoform X2 n=1 Tax=Pecten maximus TaxID=6579 RepID=UPI00145898A5|nr:PH and SEC7 domain-containing protein 2-like isoform X2 [Pecten maximus]